MDNIAWDLDISYILCFAYIINFVVQKFIRAVIVNPSNDDEGNTNTGNGDDFTLDIMMTIWPLEKSFQNYEQSAIPFVEAFADGNCSNKLAGLVKLHRPLFRKISPFDRIRHFECCNVVST